MSSDVCVSTCVNAFALQYVPPSEAPAIDKFKAVVLWIVSIVMPLFAAAAFATCWIRDLIESPLQGRDVVYLPGARSMPTISSINTQNVHKSRSVASSQRLLPFDSHDTPMSPGVLSMLAEYLKQQLGSRALTASRATKDANDTPSLPSGPRGTSQLEIDSDFTLLSARKLDFDEIEDKEEVWNRVLGTSSAEYAEVLREFWRIVARGISTDGTAVLQANIKTVPASVLLAAWVFEGAEVFDSSLFKAILEEKKTHSDVWEREMRDLAICCNEKDVDFSAMHPSELILELRSRQSTYQGAIIENMGEVGRFPSTYLEIVTTALFRLSGRQKSAVQASLEDSTKFPDQPKWPLSQWIIAVLSDSESKGRFVNVATTDSDKWDEWCEYFAHWKTEQQNQNPQFKIVWEEELVNLGTILGCNRDLLDCKSIREVLDRVSVHADLYALSVQQELMKRQQQ